MEARVFEGLQPRRMRADQVQEGMWIIDPQNPRFDRRIVDVTAGPLHEIEQVKIHTDYGNGGEPATSFYAAGDLMQTLPYRPQ